MPLLIDTYNVLRQTMPPSLAGLDEVGLCRALVRSGLGGGEALLVCDGKPKPHAPEGPPLPEAPWVRIMYAGAGRSADALVMELVDADSAPRRLIVVSDDREIQKAARRRRAESWGVERFIHELVLSLSGTRARDSGAAPRKSHTSLPDHEVRRWADEFGVDL